jgi:hypothetical protein
MSRRTKKVLVVLAALGVLLTTAFIFRPTFFPFIAMQASGILNSGTWQDDPKNWYRAFREEQPSQVKVVHSKYWRSNHFTLEFMYYFEVEATPEWRDSFLMKKGLALVSPSFAGSFRAYNSSDDTPDWFAPDPVSLYDVWDKDGYHGSVWINKTNGHLFSYEWQL